MLLLLTLMAVLSPVLALLEVRSASGAEGLLSLTLLAVAAGLIFARSRLSAGKAAAIGGLMGAILVITVVGRLVPPVSFVWREIRDAAEWLGLMRQGLVGWPLPLASTVGFVMQRLNDLGVRLWWWSQTVASGGAAQEAIVVLLLAAFLAWSFGLFATWQIYRRRDPLVGLLPSGLSLSMLAFFRGGMTTVYLFGYLFSVLWLLAACHLWTRWERWDRTGTDYPTNLGLELILALGPWLAAILMLATFFPVIHPEQVRDTFWKLVDGPWSAVERFSERLFGPIEYTGFGRAGPGGSLPRAHLLGSGPELTETIVLYVRTNDPPPPPPSPEDLEPVALEGPRRYWRNATYDTYTGQGWINGPLEQRAVPADQLLYPHVPGGVELLQEFELLTAEGNLLYAANAPLQLDQPTQAWWRAAGDLAELAGNTNRYTVISQPPDATVAELRTVPSTLPPDLEERYLALTDAVPQRVLDLAEQVTAGAESRYDQAHALELFLRTYTYTLDLPAPPADRDVVDFFLFEQQEGYCDYYASAMVVMARAVGIPSRFASGYAQGTYDPDQSRWLVTEREGHSWAEVYFEGIGWVEFEPTAGQPALIRAGDSLSMPEVPPLPPRSFRLPRLPWMLAGLGGVLLLLVATVVWIWRSRGPEQGRPIDIVRDRYRRLARWGERLGHPLRDGQTPLEYGRTLSDALRIRGQKARWSGARQASLQAPPEVDHLTDSFIRAQYGREPIEDRESWRIRDLWIRLRRHLRWLWLAR